MTKKKPDEPQETIDLVTKASSRPLAALLRVVGSGATYVLRDGKCIIGAGSTCNLVVREPAVSRTHAELELCAEGVRVRDLGSRNGTFYLGQRIETAVLGLGAQIRVGETLIAIDAEADPMLGGHAALLHGAYRQVLGTSLAMRKLFAALARLEGALVPTLLTGESGVGKEVVARALHDGSKVASGPFVAVNCGALARDLVGSELFGHKRGAFTGASEDRKGAFESADGGTLFLDEVGELPIDVQPILLRALELGEIRPIGSDRDRKVKVRVVSATNRSLEDEIQAGRFREDLYFRLAVVHLRIAPLRERREDIEPLARGFAKDAGLDEIPGPILEQLRSRAWPGNARELRNVMQAYAVLGALPPEPRARAGSPESVVASLVDVSRPLLEQREALTDVFTRQYLVAALAASKGNQTLAAKLAGIDRSYLVRLMARYGLREG